MTQQASGWQTYKRLLGYSKAYWRRFALGIVGFILNAQTEWAAASKSNLLSMPFKKKMKPIKTCFHY
jgi:subfamily B ATP-binding cassette protein MsbA